MNHNGLFDIMGDVALPPADAVTAFAVACSVLVLAALLIIAVKRVHWYLRPSLLVLAVYALRVQWPSLFYLRKVSEYTNCDYLHLHYMNILYPGYHTLSNWGYKVSYWTVDYPRDIRNVVSLNAESIITNRPGLARSILDRIRR